MQERRLGQSGELSPSGLAWSRGELRVLPDMKLFFLAAELLHSSYKVVSYKELIKKKLSLEFCDIYTSSYNVSFRILKIEII